MKDTELAYLAGFFDGEGCIALYKRNTWGLQVTVSQNSYAVLDMFDTAFPGGTFTPMVRVINLAWYTMSAWPVIETLRPHLIVKRAQAELAQEYIDIRRKYGRMPATFEDKTRIEAIAMEMKSLKRPANERGR